MLLFRRWAALLAVSVALSACGGSHTSTIPVAFPNFQRVEPAPAGSIDLERDGRAGTAVFKLGDGGSNAVTVYDARVGADGNLYYSTNPNLSLSPLPVSGEIGQFNFTSHAQKYQTVSYNPGFIDETTNGAVWVEEFNNSSGNPAIDRYAGINGADTPIPVAVGPLSPGGLNGITGGVAIGADGEFWFGVGNSGPGGNDVGEINQSTNAVTLYALGTPSGGSPPSVAYMALGSDKHIYATDFNNDGVIRITSSGSSKGTNTFTQLPQGPFGPPNYPFAQGDAAAGTDIYAGVEINGFANGALDVARASATPTFSSINLPALGISPLVFAYAPGKLYFIEYHFEGLGIYNTATHAMVILPTSTLASGAGIAVDATGTPWISCVTSGVACIESVKLSSTWAVYPALSIKLYTKDPNGNPLPPGLLGIGETGNSGPFTVKSSNTAICTANVIKGFGHNVQLDPVAAGKCVVTITDAHARSVNVAVTVVAGKGSPRSVVRGHAFLRP